MGRIFDREGGFTCIKKGTSISETKAGGQFFVCNIRS